MEARDFVHSLGLKSVAEWDQYNGSDNRPDYIPSTPRRTYKNKGWVNQAEALQHLCKMCDWLLKYHYLGQVSALLMCHYCVVFEKKRQAPCSEKLLRSSSSNRS